MGFFFFFPTSRTRYVYVGPPKSLQVRSYMDTKIKMGGFGWLWKQKKKRIFLCWRRKMGALYLLPLSICSLFKPRQSLPKTHFSNPIFSPNLSSIKLSKTHFSHESVLLRSTQNDSSESRFLDENGVVDDMDGYLNYLSLEYDSVWDTKPSW